jgi:2-keto-4-pentenoate hydratase/2-oxohepta-3-ene-1,7-dioic acid hydratase in catechol pathway
MVKIVRFLSDQGEVLLGELSGGGGGEALVLQGELFGELERTTRKARVGRLLSPLDPPVVIAVGLNYRGHAEETKLSLPDVPVLFLKAVTSVIGPDDPILLPAIGSDKVDYEAELAVVIGKRTKNVSPEAAFSHILGYTCANDVSARDWQLELQKGQWARGKSFDTFCPLGPCLVTSDEIPDPNTLPIRALLNDRVLQESNTADMIFNVQTLISDLSRSFTLLPGTVILTGTPEGVGFTRKPQIFLQQGDRITIEIGGIGRLSNRVDREAV